MIEGGPARHRKHELGSGVAGGDLSHAYLLFGGNRSLNNELGEKIISMMEEEPEVLLDGLVVENKTGASIGIEAVREIIHFIWQKPIKSLKRSVFIKNAEDLTTEAQNALLKTVEAPPPSGFIIFSVKNPENLVKPLLSRLQKIYVSGSCEEVPEDEFALAVKFLKSDSKAKKDIIGKVLDKESNQALENFIKSLLVECHKDPLKNFDLMRRLTDRFYKISEFNTNKKLQLETLM